MTKTKNHSESQNLDLFSSTGDNPPCRRKAAEQWAPVYRVQLIREREVALPTVTSPADVARVLCDYLQGADREHFVAVLLAASGRIIGLNTVHIGSLTASIVSARETFKPAILGNAARVAIGHNHPSGNLEPSREDIRITRKLVEAGKLLDIAVVDSLVIGHGGAYTSLAERGIIDQSR